MSPDRDEIEVWAEPPNSACCFAPGLFFNGYRFDLSGQLRLIRGDARAIARAVRRQWSDSQVRPRIW